MKRLDGKVALIAGGATGIGEAIVRKFADEGAKVVVAGLPDEPVLEVVEKVGKNSGKVIAFVGDLADETTARACVDETIAKFGKLNVFIHNGGPLLGNIEAPHYSLEIFDQIMNHQVRSLFLMSKFALPHLQNSQGNIIATGSEAGALGMVNNTLYGGTKGFTHAFIKGLAAEQLKYGVRANCVCPGLVDLPENHGATATGRRGTPDEIASVYAFLASDMASYVSGALWTVDGESSLGKAKVVAASNDDGWEDEV